MWYIGFLKKNTKYTVLFRSIKIPKQSDVTYFVKVIGPFETESQAKIEQSYLRSQGYHENPVKNPAYSERQRKFMCAELGRKRAGKKTQTGMTEVQLRDYCRRKNPVKVISHRQALALTKKIVAYGKKLFRHEQAGVRENPGINDHMQKFLFYTKELEKYVVGSRPYIELLAKAYEHLESVEASKKQSVG